MKHLILLTLLLFLSFEGYSSESVNESKEKLKILTWSGIIAPEVISEFEKKYNVETEISYYHNIQMRNDLLKNEYIRSYDIIITSNTSLEDLVSSSSIEKLNFKKIKNYANLDHSLVSNFSYSSYAIALNYSSLGIVYRKDKIKNPPKSWKEFTSYIKENRNKGLLPKNPYDLFSILYLSNLGHMNNITENELFDAANLLNELDDYVLTYNFPSLKKDDPLISGTVNIGATYNFDARKLLANYDNIGFYYPLEGTRVWVDSISVLSHSKMKEYSYKFIDFLLEQKSAYQNFKFSGYSSTNFMHDYEDVINNELNKDNKLLLPSEDISKHTVHKYEPFISDKEVYFYSRIVHERNKKESK